MPDIAHCEVAKLAPQYQRIDSERNGRCPMKQKEMTLATRKEFAAALKN